MECGDNNVDGGEECDPTAANTCPTGQVCGGTCQCIPPISATPNYWTELAVIGFVILGVTVYGLRRFA